MPAEPPTAGSLSAIARAAVSVAAKACGVAMSGAAAPARIAIPIGARPMSARLAATILPFAPSASIAGVARIRTSAVSPAARRACSAPIGSNTMSAAAPPARAKSSASARTATCIERAQNTLSIRSVSKPIDQTYDFPPSASIPEARCDESEHSSSQRRGVAALCTLFGHTMQALTFP